MRTPARTVKALAATFTTLATTAAVALGTVAPAEAAKTVRYVALGDSYTASPGTTLPVGSPLGCLRSLDNYPRRVASANGYRLTDVSCSGATTEDFSSAQRTAAGTNAPQYDALSRHADIVSVGIGGNDIGFADIIQKCAELTATNALRLFPSDSPCEDFYTSSGADELEQRIDALAPEIAVVLDTVRARTSKRTEIRLVGYPAILPETYLLSCPAGGIPFTPDDVAYLRDVEKDLNATLAAEAAGASSPVTYVDTYTDFIGHDACQPATRSWINGLTNTGNGIIVHPKSRGQASMARSVLGTL